MRPVALPAAQPTASKQSDQNLRGPRLSYAADDERGSSKAAERRQMSIDNWRPHPSSAANPPHLAAAIDRRDRQTDERTEARPF